MLRLLPEAEAGPVSADELARVYAYPDELAAPYVRMNFVATADGAATVSGVTEALSSKADKRVFGLLRELAEVIVVGAATARAEDYGGARKPNRTSGVHPRIAVVTASGELDPSARLFTETSVPPLVVATGSTPESNLRPLVEAGGEVVRLDGERVTPAGLLAALEARGLRRVLCEGGPRLFGELIGGDAVDELCLTVAPVLAGGAAGRIAHGVDQGDRARLRGLRLASVLTEDDVLLLRYLRDR